MRHFAAVCYVTVVSSKKAINQIITKSAVRIDDWNGPMISGLNGVRNNLLFSPGTNCHL